MNQLWRSALLSPMPASEIALFAYLVNEVGTLPGNILCVTFTNKSAAEMRQRIRALTGDSDTGHICTFHSFFHIFCKTDLSSRFFRILFALFYQFFIWP